MEMLKDILGINRYAIERRGPHDEDFVRIGTKTLRKSEAYDLVKILSTSVLFSKYRVVRV